MQSPGVKRPGFAGVIWGVVALAGLSALLAQTPPKAVAKWPLPAETPRKAAQAKLREVYGGEYSAAASPEQKAALAAKLAAKADEAAGDQASHYVLLAAARDLAVQAGQTDAALRAIDKMAERFAFDPLAAKVEAVRKLADSASSSKQLVSLATLADKLVDEACAADQFPLAEEVHKTALDAAKKSKSGDLFKRLTAHAKQIEAASRAYEPIKPVFAVLEDKPADPEANLAAGKYLCFVKGDWEKGVSMLALGSDEPLSKVARKDLEGANDAEGRAALGDAWWKLAESEAGAEKKQYQARAGRWYQQALPQLSGLAKEAVEKHLREIELTKSPAGPDKDAARVKSLAGAYLAVIKHRKSKTHKTAAWDFRADGSLAEEDRVVGTWTVSEAQIVVKFNDATRAGATIKIKKGALPGTLTFQDGQICECELWRDLVPRFWQYQLGSSPPVKLRIWPNNYADHPKGYAIWRQEGALLTLRWSNGDVDICDRSRDGRSYSGRNQHNERVHITLADR